MATLLKKLKFGDKFSLKPILDSRSDEILTRMSYCRALRSYNCRKVLSSGRVINHVLGSNTFVYKVYKV